MHQQVNFQEVLADAKRAWILSEDQVVQGLQALQQESDSIDAACTEFQYAGLRSIDYEPYSSMFYALEKRVRNSDTLIFLLKISGKLNGQLHLVNSLGVKHQRSILAMQDLYRKYLLARDGISRD